MSSSLAQYEAAQAAVGASITTKHVEAGFDKNPCAPSNIHLDMELVKAKMITLKEANARGGVVSTMEVRKTGDLEANKSLLEKELAKQHYLLQLLTEKIKRRETLDKMEELNVSNTEDNGLVGEVQGEDTEQDNYVEKLYYNPSQDFVELFGPKVGVPSNYISFIDGEGNG